MQSERKNSESLQKNNHLIYKDFFSRNKIVISAPNIFTRGYSASKTQSNIQIKQKLPTKMYL